MRRVGEALPRLALLDGNVSSRFPALHGRYQRAVFIIDVRHLGARASSLPTLHDALQALDSLNRTLNATDGHDDIQNLRPGNTNPWSSSCFTNTKAHIHIEAVRAKIGSQPVELIRGQLQAIGSFDQHADAGRWHHCFRVAHDRRAFSPAFRFVRARFSTSAGQPHTTAHFGVGSASSPSTSSAIDPSRSRRSCRRANSARSHGSLCSVAGC